MTLVILGIDALDAAQVHHFEAEELQLDSHGPMETFNHKNPIPYTGEVWPAVATGVHPVESGFTHGFNSTWDNPIIEFASNVMGPYLNHYWRTTLGDIIRRATGSDWQLAETDQETFFDGAGRYVHNWPCTINGNELQRIWRQLDTAVKDEQSKDEFDRQSLCMAAEKFGWLLESLRHEAVIAATHIHLLDSGGHAYGDDKDRYQWYYERVCDFVRQVKTQLAPEDELLLISDHGMNTNWLPRDGEVGHHSFRAYSASSVETRPRHVLDVRSWVEQHVGPHEDSYMADEAAVEVPEEHLRELGYIE